MGPDRTLLLELLDVFLCWAVQDQPPKCLFSERDTLEATEAACGLLSLEGSSAEGGSPCLCMGSHLMASWPITSEVQELVEIPPL